MPLLRLLLSRWTFIIFSNITYTFNVCLQHTREMRKILLGHFRFFDESSSWVVNVPEWKAGYAKPKQISCMVNISIQI